MFVGGGLSTVMMDEAHVSGLMCQTINEQLLSKSTCKDTITNLVEKMASKFVCMESCTKGKVYGNMTYHPDSNLCLAMVHSGEFTDFGEIKYANVAEEPKLCDTFTAAAGNGIASEAKETQSKC
mmetsp:Transcript_47403/g.40009  ORF Transcript_47403/g.40009 Transcript_47403/m.40009 type:complete len:124 (-) Transcript_47403:953-1324(-)